MKLFRGYFRSGLVQFCAKKFIAGFSNVVPIFTIILLLSE